MKLLGYYSMLGSFIVSGVVLVAVVFDTGRRIFPPKIIYRSAHDVYNKIGVCSMDLSQCDVMEIRLYAHEWLSEFASHNNLVYVLIANLIVRTSINLFIFDMYGDDMKIVSRIYRPKSDARLTSPVAPVIAVHDGYIYTQFETELYKCPINVTKTCEILMEDTKFLLVGAIKFHMEYIYMLYPHKVVRCSDFNVCDEFSLWLSDDTYCVSMAISAEYLYVADCFRPYVLRYKTDTMERDSLNIADQIAHVTKKSIYIYIFNQDMYFITKDRDLVHSNWKCKLTDLKSCEEFNIVADNFIIAYSSVEMLLKYRDEDVNCSWQTANMCPPFYVAYEKDNTRLELRVSRDGKLIDANGKLFDTSTASFYQFDTAIATHGTLAAIFVMNNDGSIYASNYHAPYRYHHSSLLAGKPVSSAGLLRVSNGVIEFVSSCSNHYQVPPRIAEQLLDSLHAKGYNASVLRMVHTCT